MKHRKHAPRVCAALAAAALAACATQARQPSSEQGGGTGPPPIAVNISTARAADLTDAIDVVGSLTPKFAADVKSEVTGTITAVYVTDWVAVRKGDPLARLDTSEADAGIETLKAAQAQASVMEMRARHEHARALELNEYGLITSQALDEARTELDAAQAATAAAGAQIRAAEARRAKSFIRAPMDGLVAKRAVSVGDRVENMGSSDPMFRLVDNRVLDLTFTVPSARLPDVHVGQALTFTTDALPGRTFDARVMFINPTIDQASRSASVVASVTNRDNALKGGLFVRGRIVVSSRANVVQVPREALLEWDVRNATAQVFVVKDGRVEKRTVKVGLGNDAAVEIAGGITAGEQVVTRGGFALRSGARVTVSAG